MLSKLKTENFTSFKTVTLVLCVLLQTTCKCGLEVRMTREAMVIARKKINKSSRSITRATCMYNMGIIECVFVFVFIFFFFYISMSASSPASIPALFVLVSHFPGFSLHFWEKKKEFSRKQNLCNSWSNETLSKVRQ